MQSIFFRGKHTPAGAESCLSLQLRLTALSMKGAPCEDSRLWNHAARDHEMLAEKAAKAASKEQQGKSK